MGYWTMKLLNVLLIIVSVQSQEVFNTMPPPVNTNFTCRGRDTGFYADVETNCRAYHTCDDYGNKFTYHCPEETAFRQEALVCDHARLVDCAKGRRISNNAEATNENNANSRSSDDDSSSKVGRTAAGRSFDVYRSENSDPAYTRSFRITAEPPSEFPTPKSVVRKQPTFVLNSSVFLRDRVNSQKASTATSDNGGAAKGPKNVEKIDKKQKEDNNDGSSGKFLSTTVATTFKPFGSDFRGRMGYGDRNFEEGGRDDGFHGRFSSTPFASTFRPFGADFMGSLGNPMGLGSSNLNNKNVKMGFSGSSLLSSMISTTTLEPYKRDFKVEAAGRNPSDFGHRSSNTKDANRGRFSAGTTSTTSGPFGDNFKVPKSSGDVPKFANVGFDKTGGDSDIRMTSGRFDHQEIKSTKGFSFDDKRGNDQKSEFGSLGSDGRTSDRSGGFESAMKNQHRSSDGKGFDKNIERPSSFFDNNNFPYLETLRSMQAKKLYQPNSSNAKTSGTRKYSASTTIAGTEFPVHTLDGSLSPLVPNELDDDPYYPKRSTTTEAYYRLNDRDDGPKRPFRFSTRRPWPGSLDFEIPEVLPDLNTLDDLVDRRKLFFIPRVKTN